MGANFNRTWFLDKYGNSRGYKSGHSFLSTAQKRVFNHSDKLI